jgi:hypothetical protein
LLSFFKGFLTKAASTSGVHAFAIVFQSQSSAEPEEAEASSSTAGSIVSIIVLLHAP